MLVTTLVVVVLLAAGIVVAINAFMSNVNNSIPQANLFGTSSPSITGGSPTSSPTQAGMEIPGPLNILIVGVDTRTYFKGWVPHADSVMLMHVDADHTHVTLTSLPRDLLVDIPAFGPADFGGERSKLTHAMAFGSMIPGKADPVEATGFQLLAKTISNYTGITNWTAGAVLTFQGMKNVVNALGGIDIYVDQLTVSIHLEPDGTPRPPCDACDHGFGGPQAVYKVGNQHMNGWQALDFSRQRYLDGAAYTRDRHERQVVRAMISKIIHTNFMTDPLYLGKFLKSLGSGLLFDGRGHQPIDFAYTLRHVTPQTMTLVGLPGGAEYAGGEYQGEDLDPIQAQFFSAWRSEKLGPFLAAHKSLINTDPPGAKV
jgi:anionic cell wall polymer biosynthesis LytR-Cps2A-Psr (LCP) family protein